MLHLPETALAMATAAQFVITLLCIGALICRMHLMTLNTLRIVRLQHGALFAGLVMSLALPGQAAHAALSLGVLAFLAASTLRWRHGPPPETTASKPMPLDMLEAP